MPDIRETADAAASAATAYTLGIGQTLQGNLGAVGDHDWYRVQLVAGQTYTFAMVGTGGTHLEDTLMALRNSAGVVLASSDDDGPGQMSGLTFTASTTGTYYIDAGAFDDDYAGQYGVSAVQGSLAHYDEMMGAGNLFRAGASWAASPGASVSVSWSISSSNSAQQDASGNATAFVAPSAAQVAAVQTALGMFADVANISFTQLNPGGTSNSGTIRINAYNSTTDGAGAYAYFPGSTAASSIDGDVNLNNDSVSTTNLAQGTYSFYTVLHELGHSLGLDHPGDYNAAPGVSIEYDTHAQFREDTAQYTVMSYFDASNTSTSDLGYPDTLMMFDILAIQQMYGVDRTARSGNSIYGFNANTGSTYNFVTNTDPLLCIWDGAGTDTLDASQYNMAQIIDLRDGSFSDIGGDDGNISIAIGAIIERALGGSGNDTIFGNAVSNYLMAGAGNDTVNGLAGNDTLAGLAGNDTLQGGLGADYLSGGAGTDRATYASATSGVKANLSTPSQNTGEAKGDTYSSIENLTGSNFNDSLSGTSGANSISGGTGHDVINGMKGDDSLSGGSGNDRIYGHLGNDTLTGNAGNDTFIFHQALGATNIDTITDFNPAQDTIELWNDVFTVLGSGPLASTAFKDMAVSAKDTNDRIIYNSDTGILYYDADGSGTTFGNLKFATLTSKPDLTASDFTVV